MTSQISAIHEKVTSQGDPVKAKIFQRFFKTGVGEYGYGDVFAGLTVPESRLIAKEFRTLTFSDLDELLQSQIHEERLIALLILVFQFLRGTDLDKKQIFDFYLSHTDRINNWDLVDLSAYIIVGGYLYTKDTKILVKLAHSDNLWERRIAIISTFSMLKQGDSKNTLEIATLLLNDKHDLIHKAVGWMLREMGKRCSQSELEDFLEQHATYMPRTMLRYAIEKFSPDKRQYYLQKKSK